VQGQESMTIAPHTMGAHHWEHTYPAHACQVGVARHAIEDFLSGSLRADDAGLVVSEFATNSVLHSSSGDGGEFTLRVGLHQDYIWLECEDAGGVWYGPAHDGRPHGLDIVHALCGRSGWGVDKVGAGRVVWARLDLAADRSDP
jgi:serine/threonine-protein kinase RsbW